MPYEINVGAPRAAPLSPAQSREKRRQARFISGGMALLAVLLFALLARVIAFEGAVVISDSMKPALAKGDYVLIDHRLSLRPSWGRGDIVFFKAPETWTGTGQTLVKRIVAVPGETVAIQNGILLVNGAPLKEDYLAKKPEDEVVGPRLLAEDEFFVLGDNRDYSDDSSENGPIQQSDMFGRCIMKLWPLGG